MCQTVEEKHEKHRQHHHCACNRTGEFHSEHRVPASHDLEYPEVRFPTRAFFAEIGEERLRALVWRHHGLLRADAEIGHLFAADDAVFAERIRIIANFFVEACGGPAAYSATEGNNVCIRSRHFLFEIDERAREIWLEKLHAVLEESELSLEMREMYWIWLEAMSIRMVNRRRSKGQPLRLSYAEARERFGKEAAAR